MALSLDINALRAAVRAGRIEWQRHALQRMMERGIVRIEVEAALLKGEQIEDYPNAYPLPAALFLGGHTHRPIHVAAAFDPEAMTAFIITAYEPTLEHFEPSFRTRRRP